MSKGRCLLIAGSVAAATVGTASAEIVGPRYEEQVLTGSYEMSYGIGDSGRGTLTIPTFDNSRGNLYSIRYQTDASWSYNAGSTSPTVPDGTDWATDTLTTAYDLSGQKGPFRIVQRQTTTECQTLGSGPVCPAKTYSYTFSKPYRWEAQWNPALNGFQGTYGGPIDVTAVSEVQNLAGTMFGSASITGPVVVTYGYDARSSEEYAREILRRNSALITPEMTDAEKANEFYQQAIETRTKAYPGSTVNENIKEVEYMARGLRGGYLWNDTRTFDRGDLNDLANMLVPIATPIYDGLKRLRGGRGIDMTDNLPASQPGGSSYATEGWWYGARNIPLNDALDRYYGDGSGQNPTPTPTPAPTEPNSPADPILPMLKLTQTVGDTTLAFNGFHLNIANAEATYAFDPPGGSEYVVGVAGLFIDSVVVFDFDGSPEPFTLIVGEMSFDLMEGESLSFLNMGMTAVDGFALSGVTPDLGHLVFGLDFSGTGEIFMGVMEVSATAVPEPGAMIYFGGALMLGLRLMARRRVGT